MALKSQKSRPGIRQLSREVTFGSLSVESTYEQIEALLSDFDLYTQILRDFQHRIRTPLMIVRTLCSLLKSEVNGSDFNPRPDLESLNLNSGPQGSLSQPPKILSEDLNDLLTAIIEIVESADHLRLFEAPTNTEWRANSTEELAQTMEGATSANVGPRALTNRDLLAASVRAFKQSAALEQMKLGNILIEPPLDAPGRPGLKKKSADRMLPKQLTFSTSQPMPQSESEWHSKGRPAHLLIKFGTRLAELGGAKPSLFLSDSSTLLLRLTLAHRVAYDESPIGTCEIGRE